jgi:hypothetical protein
MQRFICGPAGIKTRTFFVWTTQSGSEYTEPQNDMQESEKALDKRATCHNYPFGIQTCYFMNGKLIFI